MRSRVAMIANVSDSDSDFTRRAWGTVPLPKRDILRNDYNAQCLLSLFSTEMTGLQKPFKSSQVYSGAIRVYFQLKHVHNRLPHGQRWIATRSASSYMLQLVTPATNNSCRRSVLAVRVTSKSGNVGIVIIFDKGQIVQLVSFSLEVSY